MRKRENVSMPTPTVYLPMSIEVSVVLGEEGRDSVANITPVDTTATAACSTEIRLGYLGRRL